MDHYKHHIIPKHEWRKRFGNLIGFNCPENIVYLTYAQHIEVHKWLYETHGSIGDLKAFSLMSGLKSSYYSIQGRAVGLSNRGIPLSIEQRHTMSMAAKNSPQARAHLLQLNASKRGIPRSEEVKQKIRDTKAARKGLQHVANH